MGRVLDIESLPPRQRLEAWWKGACQLIHPMVVQAEGHPTRGRLAVSDELGIRTIRVTGSESTVERPAGLIAGDESEVIQLTLLLSGRLNLEQRGCGGLAVAGDLAWYTNTQAYSLHAHGPFDLVHVLLPGSRAPVVREVLGPEPATPLPRDAAGTQLAAAFLHGVTASRSATDSSSNRGELETALLSLLGALPRRPSESAEICRGQDLYEAAVAFIRQHLGSMELTPPRIAAALPISVRYLHLLFAERGQSVASFVREERLHVAAADLIEPTKAHLRIAEIARNRGFVSPAHFNRAFRRRFGCTPGSYRAERKLRATTSV